MATILSFGTTDTVLADPPVHNPLLDVLNFSEDFRVLSNVPGEVVYTNITAPTDQPETIRITQRKVNNVYAKLSDVDPTAFLPSRAGIATYIELRRTGLLTDSEAPLEARVVPLVAGLSFTVPTTGAIDGEQAYRLLQRLFATLYDEDPSHGGAEPIGSILHGVLTK